MKFADRRSSYYLGWLVVFTFFTFTSNASVQPPQTCISAPLGMVSWWPGDGDADDIQDSNPGTLTGGVTFLPGKVGPAFSFDGNVGTGIFVGDKANLENLSQITVDAWVKTTDPSGDRAIVSKHSSENPSWVLRTFFGDNTGRVSFGVETNLGTTVTFNELVSTTSISDGQFHHVAGTYDGSTVKLYVDGVLEASTPLSGAVKDSIYRVVIGNYDFSGLGILLNVAFNGLIDEVEIYNRALTASEIGDIFNAGSAGKCKFTTVEIDIKPGSFPNSVNLGSAGSVPVAIISTGDFDARTVSPTTVTLAGANVRLRGRGTPMASFEDVNGDGLLDLVVHVSTEALQLSESDTEAILEGQTFSGTRIRGADSVRIVP